MRDLQYNKNYFTKNWKGSYHSQRENPTYKKKVGEIIALGFNKGRVLDIGCAYGFLLKAFEERRFETYGVDISSFALKKAKKYCKAKLFQVDISREKIPLGNSFFDIITSVFSLEHIENYNLALRECFRLLKEGGLLYILIPIRKRWLDDDYHINYFTQESLIYALEKNGFSVIQIGEEGGRLQIPLGLIRLLLRGNTNLNFVPKGTGCFISCFAKKVKRKNKEEEEEDSLVKKKWEERIKRKTPHHQQYYNREKQLDFRLSKFIKPSCRVLDIGCFYPVDAIRFAQKGCEVTAIDIAKGVIKKAEEIAKKEKIKGKIHFKVADATSLDFKDNSFDAVYDFSTIDHIPDWKKAVKEYARVVKKNGKVIVVCVNKLQPTAWLELLRQRLNKGVHPRWGYFVPLFPWQLKKELEKNGLVIKKFDSEVMWVPVLPRALDKILDTGLTKLVKKLPFLKIIGWRYGFLAVKEGQRAS